MGIYQRILLLGGVLLVLSCGKEKVNVVEVLQSEDNRVKIMETIINDDKMISQFMDKMIADEEVKHLIGEKRDMMHMKEMMGEISKDSTKAGMMMEHMMAMMEKDSAQCRMMWRKMGNNPHMKGMMMHDSTMVCPMH
ncbi:hypothetical protein SB49_13920 [Sediminicola sp. YIK13]|uniref:hypothetical protein n=1 Tax=Sediminicola sp. YIK13 TaxID=1453352 RepID=UPI000722F0BF|nr:hypothetical protein [Sediminicola sp. YIK13]ALM08786.1 hypothetical protein SB49_13920 [Sediminicola sp. YIK13]